MAATRIMSIHIGKNKTARQCITERLDTIMNPQKTNGGNLISSFACSPETAVDDFLLFRQAYQMNAGRFPQNEVIAYHVRQAFKPGEVTLEEANEIGRELAETITGNHHAFVVATHVDKSHVHNHLIFSSVDLEGQHKFRDVKRSAKDVVAISDALCIDHGLSVIREPRDKTVIFLKEHSIGSISGLENQIKVLQTERNTLHAAIREKQTRMKEINRQRQAIRDYGRTKAVYTQFRESGWSQKFYNEHREEIEAHRNAQDVYARVDGKMPTLKELTAEYDALKKENESDRTSLEEVKPKLANLKSIRHNYEILERDVITEKRYRPHAREEAR